MTGGPFASSAVIAPIATMRIAHSRRVRVSPSSACSPVASHDIRCPHHLTDAAWIGYSPCCMFDVHVPSGLRSAGLALLMSAGALGYGRDARAQDTEAHVELHVNAVPLHVESLGSRGQRVSIEGFDGGCDTPCVLMVPPGAHTLLSGGRGIRAGRELVLVPPAGLAVHLREATPAGFVGGVILTGFGVATLALGTVFVVGIAASSASDPYNQMMMAVVGVMTGVLGIPSLILGLWMLMRHGTGIDSTGPATVATAWSITPTASPGGAGLAWSVMF